MAFFLQRFFGLPVLAVRLGQDDGTPCADIRLVDNQQGRSEQVDSMMVPLESFGCHDDVAHPTEAVEEELSVPPEVVSWVQHWVSEALDDNSVLWLHFVKPYGVLGAVPWERVLQPAIGIPLVRLPDALPDQDRSTTVFDLALVATAPAAEGPSTAARMGPAVARAIAHGVGPRLRLHVFADVEARDHLRRELAGMGIRDLLVHEYDGDRPDPGHTTGEVRNGWLRWVRRAMSGRNLDAVHFILHGNALGQDGAVLTPLEPESADRRWPVSVQSGELRAFLTQVGALVAGFSRPSDNYSDFGLRRLVDDLAAVRAGPVVLHDDRLDPSLDRLRECYAFLTAGVPGFPPATPSLSLTVQPSQVYVPEQVPAPTSAGDDLPPPGEGQPAAGEAVHEHFRRSETPMWLAAAERYLEEKQGALMRFRQSLDLRTPTEAERAYYAGVDSAVRKVREVLDRHAEETL